VVQFLNRFMVLHVEQHNRFFELFYERYLAAVEAAKRGGRSLSAWKRSGHGTCGASPSRRRSSRTARPFPSGLLLMMASTMALPLAPPGA
jgi:hypothetical protein